MSGRSTIESVKRVVLARLRELAPRWAPGGRFAGEEYVVRNPMRTDASPGSFKINTRTGRWADFATGDKGGDPVSFYAYVVGIDIAGAVERLARELAVETGATGGARRAGRKVLTRRGARAQSDAAGLPLKAYAAAKRVPEARLSQWRVSEIFYLSAPAVRMAYCDEGGELVSVRFRLGLDGDGNDRFRWKRGDTPLLYGLWRLDRAADHVVLVEGESDCHTLWLHEENAVGLPGAGAWSETRDALLFDGFERIYVVREPDAGGDALARWLARSGIRDRVWLVDLDEFKDPSALYLAAPEGFRDAWREALGRAVRWADVDAGERSERAA